MSFLEGTLIYYRSSNLCQKVFIA